MIIYLLGGVVLAWLALQGLKAFAHADPARLALMWKSGGGAAALALAALLLVRGRFELALGLGGVGVWLLSLASQRSSRRRPRDRNLSRIRSAMIEMEFDHKNGQMRGMVLAGPDEGKSLGQMNRLECVRLYENCCRHDPEGVKLLEAYLDRRFSGWRAAGDRKADPGARQAGAPARQDAAMSEDEAYEILGLQKGASLDAIVGSHRALIKKFHPDYGGSTDIAARVNQAKDVLLRRYQ